MVLPLLYFLNCILQSINFSRCHRVKKVWVNDVVKEVYERLSILDCILKERLASCISLASSEPLWARLPRVDNEGNINTHVVDFLY